MFVGKNLQRSMLKNGNVTFCNKKNVPLLPNKPSHYEKVIFIESLRTACLDPRHGLLGPSPDKNHTSGPQHRIQFLFQ